MPNTQGHEMIAEIKQATLKEILRKAWKSGSDTSGEGVIPEHIEIPAGLAFGPYTLKDGTVQIPQDELDLKMNTVINGVDIKMGTIIHVEIENPPVESATFFDMTADITVETPIRVIGDTDVYALLENLPAGAITSVITSGNPVAPVANATVEEYVHQKFAEEAFPRITDPVPITFLSFNMKARIELFDDISNPARRIEVSFPDANNVELAVPVYMRFYDITGSMYGVSLLTPMGVNAVAHVIAPYTSSATKVTADFTSATVSLENITPADDATEGANYTTNKSMASMAGADLDQVIKTGFNTGAAGTLKSSLGLVSVDIPQVADIEEFISRQVRQELDSRKQIFIWRPEAPEGSEQEIENINNQSLTTALAIGINADGGANLPAVADFIPNNRDFAIGLSKDKVLDELNKVKNETYPSFPHTFPDKIEGKTVKLNKLSFEMRNGAIGIKGEVTVVDAILDSIDVDADFDAECILEWKDNPDGTQTLEPKLKGEPDVNLGPLAWLLSFLLGFITFGIVGGIIAVVIIAVVKGVASKIGASVAEDEVSGQLKVLEAWPQNLDNIGTISAKFNNPVVIEKSGIIFSGKMVITSTYEQTLSDMARSNGPYQVEGNDLVQFNGGADKAMTVVNWDFGDGKNHVIRKPVHRYGKSGLYISKFTVNVVEEGGVSTRHFARVIVKNVAPVVSLPPAFTINEGEVFSITGHFTDENWLDTHSATVYFGDNSKAVDLDVKETHFEPMGRGEVCISHAYCDNGLYSLRLVVRDDTGGIGEATMRITVLNVTPSVELPERVSTLVGQSIKLKALFTDPGWCDTHIGFWDTGDCHGTRRAFVTEKHKPPVLEGKAEIVHIFQKCGRFENIVVITDDEGGLGEARMIVNANRVKNPDMRHGFRDFPDPGRNKMVVANNWYPYFLTHEHIKGQAQFNAVHRHDINTDGKWAQEVSLQGAGHAGIMQQIDVNAGWTYELTANYHFPAAGSMGNARIGIDPLGGKDAGAPQVVWVEGGTDPDWLNITVRATATGNLITMFLDVNEWKSGDNIIRWDNVRLYQIQPCKDPSPQTPGLPCLEFSQFKNQQVFTAPFTHLEYSVLPRENNLVITDSREPEGVLKLAFDRRGVEVKFPDYTQYVYVQVGNYESRMVRITLLKDGQSVLQSTEIIFNEVKELEYQTGFVNEILIEPDENAKMPVTFLVKICIESSLDHLPGISRRPSAEGNNKYREELIRLKPQ